MVGIEKKPITIDPESITINEILSAGVGGSGAIIYGVTIDGWYFMKMFISETSRQCAMKEFTWEGETDETEPIEQEMALLETLPPHKNLVRYLFHHREPQKIRIFMTKYSGTMRDLIKKRSKEVFFE